MPISEKSNTLLHCHLNLYVGRNFQKEFLKQNSGKNAQYKENNHGTKRGKKIKFCYLTLGPDNNHLFFSTEIRIHIPKRSLGYTKVRRCIVK